MPEVSVDVSKQQVMLIFSHEVSMYTAGECQSGSTNEAAGFIARDLSGLSGSIFVPGVSGAAGAAKTGVILVGAQACVHNQLTVRQFRLIHAVRRRPRTPTEICRCSQTR